jgi:Zn-dependent protease with chaperone function
VFVSLFAAFTAATLAMQGHGWLVLVVGLAGGALFVLFWLLVLFWLRAFGARNDRS